MAERPEDLNLPNAVITRIIKDAVPEGVNLSKDARVAISKAASVFVLYATSCSNTLAMKAKRKTINAQDVIAAMEDMEFEKFVEPLKLCLQAYRNEQKNKREASEKKKKEKSNNAEELDENKNDNVDEGAMSSDDVSGDVNEDNEGGRDHIEDEEN